MSGNNDRHKYELIHKSMITVILSRRLCVEKTRSRVKTQSAKNSWFRSVCYSPSLEGNIRNTGVGGAERHALEGYVGLSAATTRTGSLVTSGGARSAELRRVMWVYLPIKHGSGDPWNRWYKRRTAASQQGTEQALKVVREPDTFRRILEGEERDKRLVVKRKQAALTQTCQINWMGKRATLAGYVGTGH